MTNWFEKPRFSKIVSAQTKPVYHENEIINNFLNSLVKRKKYEKYQKIFNCVWPAPSILMNKKR